MQREKCKQGAWPTGEVTEDFSMSFPTKTKRAIIATIHETAGHVKSFHQSQTTKKSKDIEANSSFVRYVAVFEWKSILHWHSLQQSLSPISLCGSASCLNKSDSNYYTIQLMSLPLTALGVFCTTIDILYLLLKGHALFMDWYKLLRIHRAYI